MTAPPITPSALLTLAANPPSDPATRQALHDAARHLLFATESHSDTETRVQGSCAILPFVKVATDLDLFNILASSNSDNEGVSGWHVSEVAGKTKADERLLHRVLRFLAAHGLVTEVGEGRFAASRLTAYAQPSGFVAGVNHNLDFVFPPLGALPQWLATNNYRVPSGSKECPFQDGKNTDLDAFGYLTQFPEKARSTFEYMAWQKVRNQGWMDGSVRIADELQLCDQDVANGRALLVDVGGGGGHQCVEFRGAFPERKGKVIVQDTEVMIGMVDKSALERVDVEPMAHDFFTPQPVKGAKAYYLRTVLHDWNDETAIEILKQLRGAMAEDSLVVLDEIVVPKKGAGEKLMLYDVTMMAALGASERSEEQWRSIFDAAGLRLRNVAIYDQELNSALVIAVKA